MIVGTSIMIHQFAPRTIEATKLIMYLKYKIREVIKDKGFMHEEKIDGEKQYCNSELRTFMVLPHKETQGRLFLVQVQKCTLIVLQDRSQDFFQKLG